MEAMQITAYGDKRKFIPKKDRSLYSRLTNIIVGRVQSEGGVLLEDASGNTYYLLTRAEGDRERCNVTEFNHRGIIQAEWTEPSAQAALESLPVNIRIAHLRFIYIRKKEAQEGEAVNAN